VSLSGNLEDVSVADALQFIHLGVRSGTLLLTSGEVTAEIGFHLGRIVSAWGPASKRLGDLLVDAGVLEHGTLQEALRLQSSEEPRRPLGQVLVAIKAVTEETMFKAVEQQIAHTVHELVGWSQGNFRFVLGDVKPIDDLAVVPGDVVSHLNLDTQMVLLDAMRIFDERNRDAGRPEPRPVRQQTQKPPEAPPLLQIISADKQLQGRLAHALPEATVMHVSLRDAGTVAPGEGTPFLLVDLRGGSMAPDAIVQLRRTRPRSPVFALVDAGVPLLHVYQAGAVAALTAEVPLLAACFRALVQTRRDASGRGPDGLIRLRRIVGDLRSGLISTTISLTLMNLISESVERAVLFLVRRDALTAIGAFGSDGAGRPLATLARGLTLPGLDEKGALAESLAEGEVRAMQFDEARLPEKFTELIGRPRSGSCAIFPVMGGQRVIALVYADNGRSERAIEELDILELAASQAGLAFENELLRRKQT